MTLIAFPTMYISYNNISSQNRAIRKGGLDKLSKELFQIKNKENLQQLLSQYLMNPLIKCIEDPIEKHRETTMNLYINLLKTIQFDTVLISILLQAIIGRLDHTPFPETCKYIILIIQPKNLELNQFQYLTFFQRNIQRILSQFYQIYVKCLLCF